MPSTVYVLKPLTDAAKVWVEDNVNYESYQAINGGVVVEWRYIESIIGGMEESGLELGRDFEVD